MSDILGTSGKRDYCFSGVLVREQKGIDFEEFTLELIVSLEFPAFALLDIGDSDVWFIFRIFGNVIHLVSKMFVDFMESMAFDFDFQHIELGIFNKQTGLAQFHSEGRKFATSCTHVIGFIASDSVQDGDMDFIFSSASGFFEDFIIIDMIFAPFDDSACKVFGEIYLYGG
jgi:hypothetical protein